MRCMLIVTDLDSLSEPQLREVNRELLEQIAAYERKAEADRREILFKGTRIDQLTYELARCKRVRFDRKSEKLDRAQASLLEEALD